MSVARIPAVVALALCALVLRGPAVSAAEHDDVVQMIESAKTAADHEAIAAHYDREAKAAAQEAERHRKMEKAYSVGPVAGKGTATPLPQHCAALTKHYENAAREYTALAAAHREMAKTAK